MDAEINEDAIMSAENEQADGDDDTLDDEMSVDEAAENEILASIGDIEDEEDNPDDEELDEDLDNGDEETDEKVDKSDHDGNENKTEPDKEIVESLETNALDEDFDAKKTKVCKVILIDAKNIIKMKTSELPKKESQKKIESKMDVTGNEQTVEKSDPPAGGRALLVYPITEEDLEGPVIKPVLRLASSYRISFQACREHSKQGVLDLRFNFKNTSKEKVIKLLSDVKLCGEIQPNVEESSANIGEHFDIKEKAMKSISKKEDSEEQPVSVFVNNIPLDVRVEMLHFLYPSARSIQLPVNSQSAVQGYAIVEFPNLIEAKAIVKNNRTYPAEIGGKYLNMHVIGHEEDTGRPEPQKDKEKNKPSERPAKRSERSPKRSDSLSKSSSPKRSRRDSAKRDSSPRRSTSKTATERRSRKLSDQADDGDRFNVFVGNVGLNTSNKTLEDFLLGELIRKDICSPSDSPIKKMKNILNKNYKFAVFRSRRLAKEAIKALNGVKFEDRVLNIKEGQNNTSTEANTQRPPQRSERRESDSRSRMVTDHSFRNCTIYVAHAPSASAKEFSKFFNQQFEDRGFSRPGENVVKDVRVKQNRNYQFVDFFSETDARTAIEVLNGIEFKSHSLSIKFANEDPVKDSGVDFRGDAGFQPMLQQSPMNMNLSNFMDPSMMGLAMPAPSMSASAMHMTDQSLMGVMGDDENGYDVFVGKLPSASYEEIETFFRAQFVLRGLCSANDNPIRKIKYRERRKFQFLVFYRLVDALSCMRELDGVVFKGSELKVQAGSKVSSDMDSAVPFSSSLNQSYNQPFNHPLNQSMDQLLNPMMLNQTPFNHNPQRQMQDYSDFSNYMEPGMGGPIEEPIEDRKGEYHVFFGDVPDCRPTELLDFIKNEFRRRGLCGKDENPVKRLSFTQGRIFQFAVFGHSADAKAAVEELNGAIFKGSKITTKAGQINEDEDDRRRNRNRDSSNKGRKEQGGPKIFIGNLPKRTKRSSLEALVLNELTDRGIIRPGENPIQQFRFADNSHYQFLTFTNSHYASQAVACLDGIWFDGSQLNVNYSNSTQVENRGPREMPNPSIDRFSVHIGSTNTQATLEDFQISFESALIQHGVCRPGQNPIKQYIFKRGRRFQYVVFYNEDQAMAAIQALNKSQFMGKIISTDWAKSHMTD